MAALLAQTGFQIPTVRRGQEVSGKIISASRNEILVDIGAKSEGIIFGREITAAGDLVSKLAPGDTIEATVVQPENETGQTVLSLRKLTGVKRWAELVEMRDKGNGTEVLAVEINRGGVICEYFGLRGFLPASQLLSAPSKLGELIGKRLTVVPIEVDQATNRLIFSQKRPDKKDLEKVIKTLAKVKIGDKFSGVVTAILPFGIFVEIDVDKSTTSGKSTTSTTGSKTSSNVTARDTRGTLDARDALSKIEGLVHISEISWEKIEEPTKMFSVGQEVEVMVIAKDLETGRLNLSIKQLGEDPFAEASAQYAKEQKVKGTVSKVTPFGVFVMLESPDGGASGIEGLVHISKIPPNMDFSVGQEIECEIESVDTASRRISLSPIAKEKPVLYR
ncbi:30S ribosomal protein S1 [Candidatus Curtissbacteria bacterium]|nr:30S ribosomal protein S1 [Candidatus Curtissbacteria bacterium]